MKTEAEFVTNSWQLLHKRWGDVTVHHNWGPAQVEAQQSVSTPHPQLASFLNISSNNDPRLSNIASDSAKRLATEIIDFDESIIRRGGKFAIAKPVVSLSRKVATKYINGETRETIAGDELITEKDVDILLTTFFDRVSRTRREVRFPFTVYDVIEKFLSEESETPEQEKYEERAEYLPKEIKIAPVSFEWSKRRRGDYLTIIDNDTLAHSDWPRGKLVLTENEIEILNMFMQLQPGAWIKARDALHILYSAMNSDIRDSASTKHDLARRQYRADKWQLGMPGGSDLLDFNTLVKGLYDWGVIEKREHKVKRKLDKNNNTEHVKIEDPFSEYRLKPSFVIEDRRSEVAESRWDRNRRETPEGISKTLERVQESLRKHGFALITDEELGFTSALTEELESIYDAGILKPALGDHPPTRHRARDVLRFTHTYNDGRTVYHNLSSHTIFEDEHVDVQEAETNKVVTNANTNIQERPEYERVMVSKYPHLQRLLEFLLMSIPHEEREQTGIASVDFFRTFKTVVEGIHKDFGDEENGYVAIRVNNKLGEGARTRLFGKIHDLLDKTENHKRPRESVEIPPGGILLFKDKLFSHDVTPLIADESGTSLRDATVITIKYTKEKYALAA